MAVAPVSSSAVGSFTTSSPQPPEPDVLKFGMTGDAVTRWQRKLVALGYMTRAEMNTGPGVFGPKTREATAKFQRARKLEASGIAGPKTQAAMKRAYAPIYAYNHTTLQRGMKSSAVVVWQRLLVKLGYMTLSQLHAHPKVFDSVTERATKKFQQEHACVVSGKVGPNTRKQMARAIARGEGAKSVRYPVPYINQLTSEGTADDWNRLSNCGPTTMAMICKGFGFGRDLLDGTLVNWLGAKASVGAAGVGWPGVQTMASAAGLQSAHRSGADVGWVRQQLLAGALVAANGDRSVCLQNGGNPDRWGYGGGGHWIAVIGLAPNGDFLVNDPSSDCRRLSPSELARFFNARAGGGEIVSVWK